MKEIQVSGSSFAFCIHTNCEVQTAGIDCHNSLASVELMVDASSGSSPMHDNFSIYFSICNLVQQLVVSFQTSYREDINDAHFPSSFQFCLIFCYLFQCCGLCLPLLGALAASSEFPTLTVWFSYIMESSLQVDHKEETDGKRNLECAMKGLFITHSTQQESRGPPERRNHRGTGPFVKVLTSYSYCKEWCSAQGSAGIFCVSCEDVYHASEKQEYFKRKGILLFM